MAVLCVSGVVCLNAQDAKPDSNSDAPEKCNLYYQATSIGQYHPSFSSPYSGAYSLAGHPDPQLEARLDEVIARIAASQQPACG